VDKARSSLLREEYRLSFLTTASEFYNSYIDFLVAHGRAKDALRIAEHSRARTLAEGLGANHGTPESAFNPEQAAARLHGVILSYWLKPGQSYLWAVTPSRVSVFKLPAVDSIEADVQNYRKVLLGSRDPLETGNSTGAQLYQTLVAPAQSLIVRGSRVIVVPDGGLHGLNFETLLAPAPKPHYWIDDAIITDSPAIRLIENSAAQAAPRRLDLLVIGDPVSASSEFPQLAQAKAELTSVKSHFAADQFTALEGRNATARAYMASDAGRFAYLHFVTHGTSSRAAPLESSIVLSPDGDNYKLYARDIMTKPLHADLVTISACYGAGTRAYTGEGLVGLSWAFLRAGSRHVIASLWEVDDASTPQLMNGLYTSLDKGKDPATALRDAKLAMLHSETVYRRPFYWATFQLYGGL
jgi:CHAT domain-containing protein